MASKKIGIPPYLPSKLFTTRLFPSKNFKAPPKILWITALYVHHAQFFVHFFAVVAWLERENA